MPNADGAELWRIALALLLLGLTVWVPGLALLRALAPGMSRLTAVAAAPAAGSGLLYVAGQALTALDLPVDGRLCLALAALGTLGVALAERRHARRWRPARLPRAVVAASALATGTWALGIREWLAVPPHNDGFNHGFFVARIAGQATLDPAVVMPHDILAGGKGVDFYPLALHQQAAVLVRLLDLDVAVAWTLTSLSLMVLAFPLGMYALGRHLFRDRRVAAACAVAAAAMPGVTYSTSWWGGYALAAGFAVSPGVLLCVLMAARSPWRLRHVAAASAGLAGVAGIHTSELTFLAVMSFVLVTGPQLAAGKVREAVRAGLLVSLPFATAVVLLSPVLPQLRRGLDERAYPVPERGLSLVKAVGEVLVQFSFVPPATPAAIILAGWLGLVLCLRRRVALPWLATWLLFGLLYVWLASFPSQLIADLTSTWYSDRFRIGYLLAFLLVPVVAAAIVPPRPRQGGSANPLIGVGATLLGVVLVATSTVDSVRAVRQNYDDFALVDADARAAFDFLAAHQRPGERVLNQHQDGSPWMYPLEGVVPVIALKTFDYERPEWADAVYLGRHVHEAGADPRTDVLLAAFDVRFVYVRTGVFPTEEPDIDVAGLERSDAWQLVFSRGSARVYERVQP